MQRVDSSDHSGPHSDTSWHRISACLDQALARNARGVQGCDLEDLRQGVLSRLLESGSLPTEARAFSEVASRRVLIDHLRSTTRSRVTSCGDVDQRFGVQPAEPGFAPQLDLSARDARVWAAWRCSQQFKTTARDLGLDKRQVKRSLARVAHSIAAARRRRSA